MRCAVSRGAATLFDPQKGSDHSGEQCQIQVEVLRVPNDYGALQTLPLLEKAHAALS